METNFAAGGDSIQKTTLVIVLLLPQSFVQFNRKSFDATVTEKRTVVWTWTCRAHGEAVAVRRKDGRISGSA